MSTVGRNMLQPYIDDINQIADLGLTLDYHSAGYRAEWPDGTPEGPRGTPQDVELYLMGLRRGLVISKQRGAKGEAKSQEESK